MRRALALLALLPLAALTVFWLVPRPLTGAACPACLGLRQMAPGLFVEPGAAAGWVARLQGNLRSAAARVTAETGPRQAGLVVLACHSPACARRLGCGTARGVTLSLPGRAVVTVCPQGNEPVTLTHELTHVHLNALAGIPALITGRFPAWLNEGMAVLISNDPRFLGDGEGRERCRAAPRPRIAGPRAFARAAGVDPGLYAAAACAALHYESQLGGRAAVLAAIGALGWRGALPLWAADGGP